MAFDAGTHSMITSNADGDVVPGVGSEEEDFRSGSLSACRLLGQVLENCYGPYGQAKLLVNTHGTGRVSTSGGEILDELNIKHPTAGVMRDHCELESVGDGATFATLLAAALVKEAEELMKRGLYPTTIVEGYKHGKTEAFETLEDIAWELELKPHEVYAVIQTAVIGQFADNHLDHLHDVVFDVCSLLAENTGDVDVDNVYFEDDIRLGVDSSRAVQGTIVREDAPEGVPERVDEARVLLLDQGVMAPEHMPKVSGEDNTTFTDPSVSTGFAEFRKEQMLELADLIIDRFDVDAVVSMTSLDDAVFGKFVDAGMFVYQGIQDEEIERIQKAVGGRIVPPEAVPDIDETDLGYAGRISVTDFGAGTADAVVFGDCPDSDVAAVIVNGGTGTVTDQAKQLLRQGIAAVGAVYDDPRVLPGGGAAEIEAASRLETVETGARNSLAVEAFADALESTVSRLAGNAGLPVLDVVPDLRQAHRTSVDAGVDLETGEPFAAYERGVIDPLKVKRAAIDAAVDATTKVLRIDESLPATDLDKGDPEEGEGKLKNPLDQMGQGGMPGQ